MGWKIGKNINFRKFLVFSSVFGRNIASWSRHSFMVATKYLGCDTAFLVATKFPGHDTVFFFVVTTCLVATVSRQQLVFLLQLVGALTSSF